MSAVEPPSGFEHPVGASAEETKGKSRNVKTPLQKEVLEASYQLNPNPNQQFRKTLAERIGLTEEQVSSWFSTRRRKDKPKTDGAAAAAPGAAVTLPSAAGSAGTGPAALTSPTAALAAAVPSTDASALAAGYASGYDSEAAGGGGSMGAPAAPAGTASRRAVTPTPSSTDAITAELLEAAKQSLPVPFREDGPLLSFVFDSVPAPNSKKGMQAAALIAAKRKKGMGAEAGLAAPAGAVPGNSAQPAAAAATAAAATAAVGEVDEQGPAKKPRLGPEAAAVPALAAADLAHQEAVQQLAALHATSTAAPSGRNIMKAERERQREEARKAKEMEKARAAQERENKKREAQLEREKKAEEKRKAAEDKRREKEVAKALLQQERAAGRKGRSVAEGGGVHHHHGPPDDLDLELEALLVRARATAAAQAAARGLDPSAVEPVVPPRPEFPPPYLMMQPAFPPELDGELGPQLIEAWGFVTGFCDLLGIPGFSMEMLLSALLQGSSSPLLGLVHIILLRQAQADMEEAHATGVLQSPQPHLMDKALVTAAQRLEEAWAWGLDPDLWRAHLGPLTWPEVLRQTALAAGAGGSRVPLKQQSPEGGGEGGEGVTGAGGRRTKRWRAPKGSVGFEGEDVVSGWVGDGPLKLQLPPRFGEGTWMSAAWRVLSVAGIEGLPVPEVVRQIAIHGYRNLGTSKNPEASVTGALSRDILFVRLRPGTYALQSIVTYHQRMQSAGKTPVIEAPQGTPAAAAAMDVDRHQDDDSDEDEGSDDEEVIAQAPEDPADAEPWTTTLKHSTYNTLSLSERLTALLWLISIVVNGPGVRMRLEARERDVAALKKQLQEDMRAEKKRRQDEAAARARAAAEQAQQKLEELQRAVAAGETIAPEAMAAAEAAAKALTAAAGGLPGAAAASRAATPVPPPAGMQQQQPHDAPSPLQQDDQQPAAATDPPQAQPQQQQQGSSLPQKQQDGTSPSPTPVADAASPQQQPRQQEPELTEQQKQELKQKQEQEAAQRAELEAELAAESARRAARAEAIRRCEELNVLRLEPLGMDRRFNKYWLLVCPDFSITSSYSGSTADFGGAGSSSTSNHGTPPDNNAGRIYVEYCDGSRWRVILRPQQLDQLKQILEPRGVREGQLHQSLLRVEGSLRAAMPGAPFTMLKSLDQRQADVQEEAMEAARQWLQRGHKLIAATLTDSKQEQAVEAALAAAAQQPDDVESPEVHQLKRDMLRVETLLMDQLQATSNLDHHAWVQSVAAAGSLAALRDCLAQLESALVADSRADEQHKGKKTRGQLKAEAGRVPLLSPAWQVLQGTPCVKGAWLVCGAEVAAAQLDLQGRLAPVLPALPAEAGEGGTPAPDVVPARQEPVAVAAAAIDPGKLDPRHEEMLQQHLEQRQGLHWLPSTVHGLSLRLAALDAVLQYPALGHERVKLYGREAICAYRYITKPAPIYAPATLDQLLAQEKAAAAKAVQAPEQQHHQRSASSPPEDVQQQHPEVKQEQHEVQQEQQVSTQHQGQRQPHSVQLDQQQVQHLSGVPTLQSVLNSRLRCAYGYSLAGRGLLQLIRGLPPYPDWTQQARLEEFSIPVSAYQAAVAAATADGTINMTLQEIQEAKAAEAARTKAEQEAKAAARAAEKAAKEAAAREAAEKAAALGEGEAPLPPPPAGKSLLPKGKVKIKLGGQAAAAAAAAAVKAGKGPAAAAAAAGDKGDKHEKHGPVAVSRTSGAAIAPKLRIKGKGLGHKGAEGSREPSRENSPVPPAAAQVGHSKGAKASEPQRKLASGSKAAAGGGRGGGGGGGRLTGRLKLHHAGKAVQQKEEQVDEELLDSSEDDD